MREYQTKIIGRSGKVSLQAAKPYSNDIAAIRAARKLCGEGDFVEVWRDEVCVYDEHPKPLSIIWPAISGKASA